MALLTVVLQDGPRERGMKRRGSHAAAAAVAVTILLGAGAWQAAASSVWAVVPTPNVGSDINELAASSALSSTDAWAVGFFRSSNRYRTLTEHWDGTLWSILPSPNVGTAGTRSSPCPPPGKPLFQAAAANLNPWTEAKVDTRNPERGPMLIIAGELSHTVPRAISNAPCQRQRRVD